MDTRLLSIMDRVFGTDCIGACLCLYFGSLASWIRGYSREFSGLLFGRRLYVTDVHLIETVSGFAGSTLVVAHSMKTEDLG